MLVGAATEVESEAVTAASGSAESTETPLVTVPVVDALTAAMIVTVAVAPDASDGIFAVAELVPPVTVPPFVEVPEENVTPVGSVSVATILVAVDGPLFLIDITYVRNPPAATTVALSV
jgi:beta-lactamase class A